MRLRFMMKERYTHTSSEVAKLPKVRAITRKKRRIRNSPHIKKMPMVFNTQLFSHISSFDLFQ